MLHHDICILGAGPGGATAALHLANAGQPCLLLDRAAFPRDKVCGDALSGKVINELKRIEPACTPNSRPSPPRFPAGASTSSLPTARKLSIPSNPSSIRILTPPPATSPSASTSIISWWKKCAGGPKSTSAKTWTWPAPSAPLPAGSCSTKPAAKSPPAACCW